MAQNCFDLRNFEETENLLQNILDIAIETNQSNDNIYNIHLKIATFYTYTNLERAERLLLALFSEKEISKMSHNIQCDTIYLLAVY